MAFLQQQPVPQTQNRFDLRPPGFRVQNLARSHTLHDGLFLSLIVLLSLVLYLPGLGFYSDDWSFLGHFSLAEDQSVSGLFRAVYSPLVQMRPVQILYYALLYKLFGVHPLGYHLVNTFVFGSGIVLFYLALRALGQPRLLCVAVPLVYALLPHYSTDRFWFATFNANLSMAAYFLSLYADLRACDALAARPARAAAWKLLALIALLASALAYEVFLPLFFFNLLLAWRHGRRQAARTGAKTALLLGVNVAALAAVAVFKALTTTRMGNQPSLARFVASNIKHSFDAHYPQYGLNFKRAIEISYGDYGLGLPRVAAKLARDYPDPTMLLVAALTALSTFAYLRHVARQSERADGAPSGPGHLMRWFLGGLGIFVLGWAVFFTNQAMHHTATGMANRTAIAAAVGVAVSLVGAGGAASALVPPRRRGDMFCALLALLCFGGFVVNNTLGLLWVAAHRRQRVVLNQILQRFPTLPKGTTFILDGVCPYVGPAVVFESCWDLVGALHMFYVDRTLRADVVSNTLQVHEDGLSTNVYTSYAHYPYRQMLIYNAAHGTVHPIPNAQAARHYFRTVNPDCTSGCPQGEGGRGVPVF